MVYLHMFNCGVACDRNPASAYIQVSSKVITRIKAVKALLLFTKSRVVTYVFGMEISRVLERMPLVDPLHLRHEKQGLGIMLMPSCNH